MKTKLLSLLLLVSTSLNLTAQSSAARWAKLLSGPSYDYVFAMTVESTGNVYITGACTGIVDFDPGPGTSTLGSASSSQYIFVLKLDASGNFIWAKQLPGAWVYAIVLDGTGNVYVAGSYFITKLDPSGNLVWTKNPGGNVNSLAMDAGGNIYLAGSFGLTNDFDPGPGTFTLTSAGQYDIFISKLDGQGNFVWARSMGASTYDFAQSITTDVSGNVFTTGAFSGIVDFDPGAGTATLSSSALGYYEIFVSKLDPSGNFLWAKSLGGNSSDIGYTIGVDNSGNVYTSGMYGGTGDFDPGAAVFNITSEGQSDVFISKLNSFGDFVWAKSIGGDSAEYCNSMVLDASANIYTGGSYGGSADFDPGAGAFTLGGRGGFISILDAAGNFINAKAIAVSSQKGYATCNSIALDNSANLHATGVFAGAIDADPDAGQDILNAPGLYDVFILKMGQLVVGLDEFSYVNNILVYPNPSKSDLTIDLPDVAPITSLKLINALNQVVLDKTFEGIDNIKIDLSALPKGIYVVEIIQNEQISRSKLIRD